MLDLEEYINDVFPKYRKLYKKDKTLLRHSLIKDQPEVYSEILEDYLKYFGEGAYFIELDDPERSHLSLSNFKTLEDFSKEQYRFINDMSPSSEVYKFKIFGEWLTWVGEKPMHCTLYSLDCYLKSEFLNMAYDYIKKTIPHDVEFKIWERTETQKEKTLIYKARDNREIELINWKVELHSFYHLELDKILEPFVQEYDGVYFRKFFDDEIEIIVGNSFSNLMSLEKLPEYVKHLSPLKELKFVLTSLKGFCSGIMDELLSC